MKDERDNVFLKYLMCAVSYQFLGTCNVGVAFLSKTRATNIGVSLTFTHKPSCSCNLCVRTKLFMSDGIDGASVTEVVTPSEATTLSTEAPLPANVEALDGVLTETEQHNTERPARRAIKKKDRQGKLLSEFQVGQTVKGRVKSLASYGAFIDIGAETDGLLHISQLSVDYVADVKSILEMGKEYDVRITKIDATKKQVGLSLLTEQEEVNAASNAAASRAPRQQSSNSNQSQRRDDSPVLNALQAKGWDPSQFVEGTVVSLVDFGAFVNVDCSQLNSEVEGVLDGLVHISAMGTNRVKSVSDVVKVNDKVKIRVKSIEKGKVSLSMVSVEDEQTKNEARGSGSESSGQGMGAADWKESLEKIQAGFPTFTNKPEVLDLRK